MSAVGVIVALTIVGVSSVFVGAFLWCKAEDVAMWLTARKLMAQGYTRSEAAEAVRAAAERLGWHR